MSSSNMLSFCANSARRASSIHSSITQTVGETPIVKLQRMAPAGINVYVKCEAANPGGSVKDRLALGTIEWAEKEGHLKPGQTIVEASSGNTGIGLAMVCAARGYPLVVVMSESFSIERRKLMRFLGAKVILTNPGKFNSTYRKTNAMHVYFSHACMNANTYYKSAKNTCTRMY